MIFTFFEKWLKNVIFGQCKRHISLFDQLIIVGVGLRIVAADLDLLLDEFPGSRNDGPEQHADDGGGILRLSGILVTNTRTAGSGDGIVMLLLMVRLIVGAKNVADEGAIVDVDEAMGGEVGL